MASEAKAGFESAVLGRCLHELVLDQARRTPDRTAVRARDGTLTYAGLESRSLAIARHLRSLGVEAETRVGIFMPRLRNLPAAMIGTMAAGGAYVPVDPAQPDARIHFTLGDADARVVLATSALARRIEGLGIQVVAIDSEPGLFLDSGPGGFEAHVEPDHLAYLIYTSGSTGVPKGVMIEHRNVAVMIDWAHREYSRAELSRVIAATSITFDLSVFEIFAPLSCGGSIDLIEDGVAFARWPWRDRATLLNTVPSVARELIALGALPPRLPVVNLAGEPLAREIVEGLWSACPGCRVYNLYGPSEDTTYSTGDLVRPGDPAPTIGRPLTGRHLYLLDPEGRPVPDGEAGEIYVGGGGVSRGYLGRPDLTEAAYLPDPLGPPGSRMYRTGDFGRALPDGRIECLGRRDDQIKLRGFRIELGEIDAVLRAHDGVEEVATVAVEHPSRGTFLRCVLALRPGTELAAVQAWAASHLPAASVPSDWLPVAALPTLPNGKLDRKALRALTPAAREEGGGAPEGADERRLAKLWAELLGAAEIRRDDDFLSLGGHSLLAARLAARVRDGFGVELSGAGLLRAGTLRGQAALIRAARPAHDAPLPAFVPAQGPAPCSPAQLRMWTLERLVGGSARYNIPLAFRLRGPLDGDALATALAQVAERHEILRTVYVEEEGELRQLVRPAAAGRLRRTDLSGRADAQAEALRLATEFAGRCFDLSEQAPFAALLIDVAPDDRLLAISTHHIAVDGSADLLVQALGAAYDEALAGGSVPEAARPSYIDFAAWLRGDEAGRGSDADLAYWREALREPPPPLPLPSDRPPAPESSGRGGRWEQAIPAELVERLAGLARARGLSMFQVLLALTWSLLARMCETDDVCVAVPVADRPHRDVAGTVGNFVNTVVLRGALAGDPGFAEILDRAREGATAAIEHGSLPFNRVVEAVPGLRQPGGGLSVNVMLSLVGELPPLGLRDVESEAVHLSLPTSRFDLSFFFREERGGLVLSMEYDGDRFEPATAGRYARHWTVLAEAALADPELPLSRLPLLDAGEREEILERWNRTSRAVDTSRLLHQLFEDRAGIQPDAIAVTGGVETLSYAELDRRASGLAAAIVCRGIAPGARIAILCDRTPHLVVAMLAVLKAGGAYVPLDPSSPADRHKAMLGIAGAAALITDSVFQSRAEALCGEGQGSLPCIAADLDHPPAKGPAPAAGSPDDLAYVIFTSGTTGLPKAVAVRHRPAVNLIDWVNRTFEVGPGDRLLFVTSVAFDLSVYDVFGTLAAGGSIRIAAQAEVQDPARLADILAEEPVTFWDSAPIALEQCVPYLDGRRAAALRLVFLSGDWIPVALPDRVRAAAPEAEVVALGGATEAVVWSNYHRVGTVRPDQSSIPYGRPIQNARYHILDARLEPVPVGVPGDLFIGGEVLAEGYLGDAELTAGKFIPDPFGGAGGRLYRTGDRARYWADGTIEFLGRLDSQVKIRGFRVEASEIETVLAAQDGVRAAHVAVRGPREDRSLCAYVVPDRADDGLMTRLRDQLRRRLPEYMMPAAIVLLDQFPLTANGKLDRNRLPEPQPAAVPRSGGAGPSNALESGIAEIWRKVLGVDRVDIDENFFDAGGNSVRLVETHRAIEALTGRRLPMVELFRHTTIRALAGWLGERPAAAGAERSRAESRLVAGRQRLAARRRG